jgi:hypothetical protein
MLERICFGLATASITTAMLYALWSLIKVWHAQEEDEAQDFQESLETSDQAAEHYRKSYGQEEVGFLPQAIEEEKDEADWWKEDSSGPS